ncbi:MAG: PAQR family membrane homeostasis protein TrhA [Candidatus Dormibacteria bacterium]
MASSSLDRPMLRGWSHLIAVVPATVAATLLVLSGPRDAAQRAALAVYGAALILLFAVSALYHRGPWTPRVRAMWRRADQATIFLMIAATYTGAGVIVLDGGTRIAVLAAVWTAAIAGIVLSVLPIRIPRAVTVLLYLGTGWIAVAALPVFVQRLSTTALALLLSGGALYTIGALTYALRRPRLWPRVFGYHEVFHLLVIAASALFYLFVALVASSHART